MLFHFKIDQFSHKILKTCHIQSFGGAMVSKVLHMMDTKWSKTSRNIAMIKFGVILKILYRRFENVVFIPPTLKQHYF